MPPRRCRNATTRQVNGTTANNPAKGAKRTWRRDSTKNNPSARAKKAQVGPASTCRFNHAWAVENGIQIAAETQPKQKESKGLEIDRNDRFHFLYIC